VLFLPVDDADRAVTSGSYLRTGAAKPLEKGDASAGTLTKLVDELKTPQGERARA
jgi:hypothetical protein